MRKLVYSLFCVILAASAGCAITNYELITDNDQYKQGSTIVNTNGKAVILSGQILNIWPDGTDNTFSMVDQKANGDRTLTTYNWYSTGDIPPYKDNLYCNPDWVGCSLLTSLDPEVGDVDIFDYVTRNMNCSGARSICMLISTTRYYGECGRVLQNLTPVQKAMALQMVQATSRGFFGKFDASNTTVLLTGTDGVTHVLPVFPGTFDIEWRTRNVRLDLTNPNVATTLRYMDRIVKQSPDNVFEARVRWNGLEVARDIKILEGLPGELALSRY